ncbi:hypothetical protein MUP29_02290 [bacterium]|nr:hypothetical protein [bacterium]
MSICDAAQLYLTRDMYSRLPLLNDGIAIDWVMDEEEESRWKKGRKVFDLWMWRAGKEGVGSHAFEGKLITLRMPRYMAFGTRRKVGERWARMDFDRGRLPFEIVLPFKYSGPEIASYSPCGPEDSASDVRGVGGWVAGRWVVEFSRALQTKHADDIPFDMEGTHTFIVNLLQGKALNESPASEVLTLRWVASGSKWEN